MQRIKPPPEVSSTFVTLAQVVEWVVSSQKVIGSNPCPPCLHVILERDIDPPSSP